MTILSDYMSYLLLTKKLLHQLICSLSLYLQGFIHPRWLFGISAINSSSEIWRTTWEVKETLRHLSGLNYPSNWSRTISGSKQLSSMYGLFTYIWMICA